VEVLSESIAKRLSLAVSGSSQFQDLRVCLSFLGFAGLAWNYGFCLVQSDLFVLRDSVADVFAGTVQSACLDGTWRSLGEIHNIIHVIAHRHE